MVSARHGGAHALGALLFTACVPVLDDRLSLVTGPTLLAVASTPAEAAPPAPVSYSALYVTLPGQRPLPTAGLSWAFCTARKALTDEGTVSPDCIEESGADLVPIGAGPSATGALPMDACRDFGPDAPAPTTDEPAGRPVDPDPTGGYYQPVRLEVPPAGSAPPSYVIGATRIACGLAGATAEVSAEFEQEYRANTNPAIASLTLVQAGGGEAAIPPGAHADVSVKVARGAGVTLRAAWADCTGATGGCTGSEPYVVFDPQAMALATRREAIQVAWFTTGGTFGDDASGRSADEAGSAPLNASCPAGTECIDNAWTAPSAAGEVLLWVVVRDDRGGVGWQSYRVDVE